MTAPAHPFDAAIALRAETPNRWHGRTSDDYWNMVSPYGGVTAGAMMQAMLDHPERSGTPLAFTLSFLAPIQAGDYVIETELVRANRNSQHWAIRLLQAGRVLAQAIAICAQRRETWSLVEAAPPEVPPADQCEPAPNRGTSEFLRRYEFRIVRGKPFAENSDSVSHVWVADNPPRPLDFASLTALCDSFLPRIFLRRAEFVPIGTVSINIYFHAGEEVLIRQGAAPLLAVAQAQAFSDGHFDHHGHVWSTNGELLATTQQLVWYKE
ncbi:MAG: thioesterase family protein [Sulfuritalea sp.]|nr:thioesterase family protein [Sulfuritalea sp.]